MAIENELNYLFQPSADAGASSVGSLIPQSGAGGAMNVLSSLAPLAAFAPFASVFSSIMDRSGTERMVQERDAALAQQQADFRAQSEFTRNGWQEQAKVDFDNIIKSNPHIANNIEKIANDEEGRNLLKSLYYTVEQRTKAQWEFDHSRQDSGPTRQPYINSPQYQSYTGAINETLNNFTTRLPFLSASQAPASSALTSTPGQSVSLDPNSPTLGASTGTQTGTGTQPLQGSFQGGQAAPQQNWLQKLMSIFQGPGNNNMLAQAGQGAGIGAGNSMGLNPLLGGVVGSGLGQIGSAFGNLFGGSQTGTQTGQQTGQQSWQQPPQQPGGFSNQNYFNGMPSGVNTGDAQQSNPLNDLFAAFGIQNPAQAGLGAGILGLGSALEKDVTLPDFWSDRGVQDLASWNDSATHPMDPNVEAAIQRSMDIQNEQQLRNLRDVYKNARPGGDYLNDSAYQRDLANLQRSMALNTADAKAGSQLQSNAQQIGVKTDLAAGSVGQGRAQALLDTQKQTNQNKLFGDLGSAFIQGSLQKPPTTNLQVNR